MVGAPPASSLKEYLKRYETNPEEDNKKKRKKKKAPKPGVTGVLVVDEDPVWQKPVKIEEEEDEGSAEEEKPIVDEDIEVKRMKRLEQIKSLRPFGAISEDGSGWVSVGSTSNDLNSDDKNLDISPPRKYRARNDTPSPGADPRPSNDIGDDLSPPRKHRDRNDSPSPQPTKSDVDLSPPRKHRALDGKLSPEPRVQHSSKEVDLSPPRKRRTRNDTPSPEAKLRSRSKDETDMSPLRKLRVRNDALPTEREFGQSRRSGGDISPPRRLKRRYESPSTEIGRKLSHSMDPDSDVSPPRRSYLQFSKEDISPTRKVRRTSPYQHDSRASPVADLSPPRKSKKSGSISSRQLSHSLVENISSAALDLSPPRRLQKEGPKTGLVTGKDVKEEIAKTKKEEWSRFKEMDPSVSGRGAEAVYRNKVTGERMSKEEFLKAYKKEEKPKESKEIKLEWGKGLAQKRETEAKLQEIELEKEKPFARSRDDPDLDKMLKERVRWGDPMAHLVKNKHQEHVLQDLGANEKMKESGFIIPQEIPSHSWIKRRLDAPPNRYGIRPGRHWDGVDRSNGFEKQMFKRMNEKQATEREAYLWSVSDM